MLRLTLCLTLCLALCLAVTTAGGLVAADFPLLDPVTRGLGPQWRFDRVGRGNPGLSATWQPLPQQAGRWSAPELGYEAPFAELHGLTVQLQHRSPHHGDAVDNDLDRLIAVVFVAPADGVYRVTGDMTLNRFEGSCGVNVQVFLLRPFAAKDTAVQLTDWSLPPYAEVPVDLGPVRLRQGEELAMLPRCWGWQSGLDVLLSTVSARTQP